MLATDGENVIILGDDLFSPPSSAMYEAKLILCGRIPGRSGWGDGRREHNTQYNGGNTIQHNTRSAVSLRCGG